MRYPLRGEGQKCVEYHLYTTQDQLKSVARTTNGSANGQWSYVYDGNGNRTNLTYSNASQYSYTYTYNAANELTKAQGTYPTGTMTLICQYDGNGNETSLTTTGATPPDVASLSRTDTYNATNQNTGGSNQAGSYSYGYTGTSQGERVSNHESLRYPFSHPDHPDTAPAVSSALETT